MENLSFDVLIELEKKIQNTIIDKIINDISQNNNLKKCLFPKNINYKNIYLTPNQFKKIYNVFPDLIHTDFDEKIYYYILGTFENITNPIIIDLLADYEDYQIIYIPHYITKYEQLIKYYNIFSKFLIKN